MFGAGTVQWSWGLDSNHDRGVSRASTAHAAGNGQPVRRHGRAAADAADRAVRRRSARPTPSRRRRPSPRPPTARRAGEHHRHDHRHRRRLRAAAVVGGVEVSVDGGATWRRATGRETWTYSWQTGSRAHGQLLSRAVDDSGNLETPSARASRSRSASGRSRALLDLDAYPDTTGARRTRIRARSSSARGSAPTSTASSRRSASTRARRTPARTSATSGPTAARCSSTVTFTGETRVGLAGSDAAFAGRDHCEHDLRRVVSHEHRASTPVTDATSRRRVSTTVRCTRCATASLARTASISYGASGFPNQTYASENYWVDVVFVTSIGPIRRRRLSPVVTPSSGASGVAVDTPVTATFNET